MDSQNKSQIMKDLEGYITAEQIDKLLTATTSKRDWMLIFVGWRTGRRISEILQLRKRDINFDTGLAKFTILKKRKETFKLKPIDTELLNELANYTKTMKPDQYIFESPYGYQKHLTRQHCWNIIQDTAERAGILSVGLKKMHPHVLRHSFAVHFLRKTRNKSISLKLLQMMLEHSNLSVTGEYLQFNQDELREELNHIFLKEENKNG